ncbi:putative phosphogluconate dehydrogenase (NADP(+)-dependent, decarboxylating) [Rosa chinensis]|uniref:Putative phosphogluconate dehydrogenase (NADP(+)-dependent, decarboxylating) n=1 Tax=Rosa chinensis TaxID=74649 RepID=A0A2P6Q022_ROSCH|nr:putative phosphogluconate dehydrogenase (NADP(+)-dependent, decarboxylating) [Rosa chinensis]
MEMVWRQAAWRRVVGLAVAAGFNTPVDRPGSFHTEWTKLAQKSSGVGALNCASSIGL